jgi:hypothetical protein
MQVQGETLYIKGLKLSCVALCFQVACNPTDNCVLVIVGLRLFRLLSLSDNTWRQYGWSQADALNITSVAWLSFDCVIAGTSDGDLLLVDNGKLKAVYKATGLTTIDMKLQEPGKGPGCKLPNSTTPHNKYCVWSSCYGGRTKITSS